MGLALHKEMFVGKYDGVTSPLLLPVGSICDGKNMRKISKAGGWKARKGVSLHNSTAIASEDVLSLHVYRHPRNGDYHFVAQCNGNLYDATNNPPGSGTTFGSSISDDASDSQPGFSDVIEEMWLYADGGKPLIWGGDNPFVSGFIVEGSNYKTDFTVAVTNENDSVYAVIPSSSSDGAYYFCSSEKASQLNLSFVSGAVNSADSEITVSAWRNGAWTAVSGLSDETADGDATHAKDGTITWTVGDDEIRVLGGIMGYWYKVTWSADLSGGVKIKRARTKFSVGEITNKWNGVYEMPAAVRFYDQSAGEFVDATGKISNASTNQYIQLSGATTSDFIYVKGVEPLTGIALAIADGYENTEAAKIDDVEYWDGDSWTSIGSSFLVDETLDDAGDSSFAQSGTLWWTKNTDDAQKREMDFDSLPGYWYRISWSASLDNTDNDVRLFYVAVAYLPESLGEYDGVIEFKTRAFLWGDRRYPNRLRYSAYGRPDCFSGSDSGYTDAFGGMDEIVVVRRFYNELLVWKKDSIYLLEGYSPATFGILKVADTVGCVAPKTAQVVEVGYAGMNRNELMSIAIWMDSDGVYVLDGRKPKKISLPVDMFFNPEYSDAMSASDLASCQAFVDKVNNEYHLIMPNGKELVYNYVLEEWYPPWERRVGSSSDKTVCGLSFRGSDDRYYSYIGNSGGKVYRTENDTSDKDENNDDVAIEQSIKTRAISRDQKMTTTFDFIFRKLWIEAKARTSPTDRDIDVKFYKDLATNGIELSSPENINLSNSGHELVVDGLVTNQIRCTSFQLEFIVGTLDLELEVYSFLYAIEALGTIDL